MSRLKSFLLAVAVVLAAGAWYWFRPERAFIDARVSEPGPDSSSVVLAGEFTPGAHQARGVVQILRLSTGEHVVRFTAFETLNGPDVRVYLLRAPRARDNAELRAAGFVDLGPLKGNIGDQNYAIPSGVDVTRYQAVSVWCRRFGVNFTTAALGPRSGV